MPLPVVVDGGDTGDATVGNVTSRDTILVKPDGTVVDAATISATEARYGIDFSFTLPKTDWRTDVIKVSAANFASYIGAIAAHDHVVAAWYAPDTNKAGTLTDTLVVVVETDSGLSDTQVEIPFSQLNTPGAFAKIDNAYASMKAIEAIT